jgi:hypothetical protein
MLKGPAFWQVVKNRQSNPERLEKEPFLAISRPPIGKPAVSQQ